jgi:hypothetical protein
MIIKEREHSKKGILLGLAMATLTLVGSGQVAIGRGVGAAADRGKVKLTLRVYDYAVSPSELSDAEAEATVILNYAGLEPTWVDCPLDVADMKAYPACESQLGRTDFILTILKNPVRERVKRDEDAMGQALRCSGDEGGCWAYIFYSTVREQAAEGDVPEFRLLGHVLAHEIGHLLLGPHSHAATGIMMARWSDEDLRTIARGQLYFSENESRHMCHNLLAGPERHATVASAKVTHFGVGTT